MANVTGENPMKQYFAEGRKVVAYVEQVNAISGVSQSWHKNVSIENDEKSAIKKAERLNKKEAS